MKKYKVIGKFKGKKIKEKIEAKSKRQAQLKAGFKNDIVGPELTEFMKSRKVKIRKI